MKRLLVIAGLVAVAALVWLIMPRGERLPADGTLPHAAVPSGSEPVFTAPDQGAPAAHAAVDVAEGGQPAALLPGARAEVPRPTGGVLVIVTSSNGAPAASVGVTLDSWRGLGGIFSDPEGVTDATGRWRADGVTPGDFSVSVDRGGEASGRVLAGEVTELRVTLPPGVLVRGRVVGPDLAPVAGAEVRSSRGLGAERVVARSGVDGRFEIRDMFGVDRRPGARMDTWSPSTRRLAAAAAGFTPSGRALVEDDGSGVHEMVLRLGPPGGGVRGRVTDSTGLPVADASVVVGAPGGWAHPWPPAADAESGPPPRAARTDADGRYEALDLPVGDTTVVVVADGHSPCVGTVTIAAGEMATLDVVAPDPATISGTVTDESGAPVAGANVNMGFFLNVRLIWTESDAGGRYRLQDVLVGPDAVEIVAEREGAGEARTSLEIAAGAHLTWNPRLSRGLRIVGRVVDAQGGPLSGLRVVAVGQMDWSDFVGGMLQPPTDVTDLAGRFELDNCAKGRSTLSVYALDAGGALATLAGVEPGSDEVVVRVLGALRPSAFATGRLVNRTGQPLAGEVTLQSESAPRSETTRTAADGRFRIGPVLAGPYTLRPSVDEFPAVATPPFELASDELHDLGDVVIPDPARIEARLVLPDGIEPREVLITGEMVGEGYPNPLQALGDDETVRVSGLLAPGDYLLVASGNFLMPARATVKADAGRDTRVTLAPEECALLAVHVSAQTSAPPAGRLRVSDGAGSIVLEEDLHWLQIDDEDVHRNFSWHQVPIRAGSYVVQVLRDGAVVAERSVNLPAEHRSYREVEIRLE